MKIQEHDEMGEAFMMRMETGKNRKKTGSKPEENRNKTGNKPEVNRKKTGTKPEEKRK